MVRAVVCIKSVYDVNGLKIDPDTGSLITERADRKISDFDKNALEEALQIREKHGGTVIALTLGPEEANDAAKEALNMGADDAYLVADVGSEPLDARATSDVLAAAIRKIGAFDLVICGEASVDMYSAQVGQRVAERLGIPQVSYARRVSINGNTVTAERDLEDAYETVEVPMPLLLTVTKEINDPRIPTITMIIKASNKAVKTLGSADLGTSPVTSVRVLKAQAPTVERKREVIEGEPEEMAEALARQLLKDGVVGGLVG